MTEEREEYLVKTFPKIYTNCGENNCYTLFRFECDDGWFRIIYWLSKYIQNHIDQNNHWAEKYPDQTKPIEQVKALQVKEKFGTLRFYIDGGDEEVYGMIKMAECMSRNVCEITGDIGSIKGGKWWSTRSPECQEKPTEAQKTRVLNFVNKIESEKAEDNDF